MLSATCYLLPPACYPLPATCCLLPATCYLLPLIFCQVSCIRCCAPLPSPPLPPHPNPLLPYPRLASPRITPHHPASPRIASHRLASPRVSPYRLASPRLPSLLLLFPRLVSPPDAPRDLKSAKRQLTMKSFKQSTEHTSGLGVPAGRGHECRHVTGSSHVAASLRDGRSAGWGTCGIVLLY